MAKTVIRNYLSLIKFSHTLFALPFALIGFVLGVAQTDDNFWIIIRRADIMLKFVLVLACMVFARSAAMAFNRYLDRHFDAANPRTSLREIPAG
ncbi:MAG: UbiA family prenyltransferase, partial [Chitinophagaceae bacterium]